MNVSIEVDVDVCNVIDWLDERQKEEITEWFIEDGIAIPKIFNVLDKASSDNKLDELLMDTDIGKAIDVAKRILRLYPDY